MLKTTKTMRILYVSLLAIFIIFLIVSLIYMMWLSFDDKGALSGRHYQEVWQSRELLASVLNSFRVSFISAAITTILAFIIAYTIYFTTISVNTKKVFRLVVTLPMLLPTITYGFILIYVFGNQGYITRFIGEPLFSIYGFNGILIGYVIYTLPAAFLLIANGMEYVDQRYVLVSVLMKDRPMRRFYHTVLRPLYGAIAGAFILSFILSFTDYGIPASIGGQYQVIATTLYQTMLGSIPDFSKGAVIAIMMLLPAIIAGLLLRKFERYTVSYRSTGDYETVSSAIKNRTFMVLCSIIAFFIVSIFSILIIVPFTSAYPYDMSFTWKHVQNVLGMGELMRVYQNSLLVAFLSAAIGITISFTAAIISVRTSITSRGLIQWISILTNTVPGMVLGLAYLLLFNGSSLKGTFLILIICNLVHFFTTPYLMMKNALEKMDMSWEVTGALLEDTWLKTVWRVIIPNIRKTIIHVFSYYFTNALVTVSGVVFLVSTNTSLLSTKIKELQHYSKFNEIFILSLLILMMNLVVMTGGYVLNKPKKRSVINEKKIYYSTGNGKFVSIVSRMWRWKNESG